MVNCPKCGKPVSGRARACGYCGESLVLDYFQKSESAESDQSILNGGSIAALVLGIFGSIALLAALVFHLLVLFDIGSPEFIPDYTVGWWIRTLLMVLLPVIHLVQQSVLRGVRFSVIPDCFWIFAGTCALTFVMRAYLDSGSLAFYGIAAIPYLLAAGCVMVIVSSVVSILAYRKAA